MLVVVVVVVVVVVDQLATIGALPVAVARACGHGVGYLPGLAMRRVDVSDDSPAELDVLVGYDDDPAGEATRSSNRIRGLLTGIHPALERVLGPKITYPAVLEILFRCGGPAGIRQAGRRKLTAITTAHGAPDRRETRDQHPGRAG